jgi:hypothetical protein
VLGTNEDESSKNVWAWIKIWLGGYAILITILVIASH